MTSVARTLMAVAMLAQTAHGVIGPVHAATERQAVIWPQGMSFVGLTDQGWRLYVVKDRKLGPVPVELTAEPRTPVYSPSLNLVVYISPTGDVIQRDMKTGNESVAIHHQSGNAYTQPFLSPQRKSLILVKMIHAKSRQTQIVEYGLTNNTTKIVSHQRSAQFEPFVNNSTLYYTNVQCVENCAGRYIHEIWKKDLISQDAQQLTLQNTLTHQPVVSTDERFVFVTSEKAGGRRIWKCTLETAPPLKCKPIETTAVADTSPALDRQSQLYFIRLQSDGKQQIIRYIPDGQALELPLPGGVTEIRDLEISQ